MSAALLVLLAGSGIAAVRRFLHYSLIAVPTLLVLALYLLVLIRTPRYVVALTVVIFALALAAVRLASTRRVLARATLAIGLAIFALLNLSNVIDAFAGLSSGVSPVVAAAEELRQSGIGANSRVATIGAGVYAYWARLARVNIAAEVWDESAPAFWSAPAPQQAEILCAMSRTGAIAVIGQPTANADVREWQQLGKSGYWMRRISELGCRAQ